MGRVAALFFLLSGLKSQKNFCSLSWTNKEEILTKYSTPQVEIIGLKLSDALKLSSKQIQLQKGLHLLTDPFKI